MSFHRVTVFQSMKSELSDLLIATAAEYASAKGLDPLDETALHQMSANMEDIAGELLMFGSDAWPVSARPQECTHPFEIAASQVDPPFRIPALPLLQRFAYPIGFLLTAIALAFGVYHVTTNFPVAIFYVTAVIATALVYGELASIVVSLLTPIFHSSLVVPPALEFNPLTGREAIVFGFIALLGLIVPWLARHATWVRASLPKTISLMGVFATSPIVRRAD